MANMIRNLLIFMGFLGCCVVYAAPGDGKYEFHSAVKLAHDTIDYVDKVRPVSAKVRQHLVDGDEHHKSLMKKDLESYMRIIEWLDLNDQVYGDDFTNKLEARKIDGSALNKLRLYVKQLFGDDFSQQSGYALINVAQYDENRKLMKPLAKSDGGWGQLDRNGQPIDENEKTMSVALKDKNDPDYKKLSKLVNECIVRNAKDNTQGWHPALDMGGGEDWIVRERAQFLF